MTGWNAPAGERYLTPHPWDGIGNPPRPGMVYDPPTDADAALSMAEKLRGADSQYEEAESLEYEARDLRREADRATEEARALGAKVNHPALVAAIEKDAKRFRNETDVAAWMEGRR